MLLAEDYVVLRCAQPEVVQQLQPQALQLVGVCFKQVEVVTDGREDVVKLGWLGLVLALDFGEDWPLNALVGLHVLDVLVRNKLPKTACRSTCLLLSLLLLDRLLQELLVLDIRV